jgi:hypothetical protein
MALILPEAIDQLGDRTSLRRRSAAKKLRKLQDPAGGAALLDALSKSRPAGVVIQDERTWETQYQW